MWIAAVAPPANPVAVGDGLEIAAIGVLGVLIGAVISGGFNLWIARRKERGDAAAESKRHRMEIRRAARLIDDDIRVASDAVRYSLEHKQWWPSAQRLASAGWREYRAVLAPDLSDLHWRQVSLAVTVIDRLQWVRDVSAKAHNIEMANNPDTAERFEFAAAHDLNIFDPPPMTDALAIQVRDLSEGLDMGRSALAPLMEDKPAGD
jgi:hypothetical protein